MSRKKISQAEAHGLKKQVEHFEELFRKQRASWLHEYPDGVHIATVDNCAHGSAATREIITARKLGFPVVATTDNRGNIYFYAVK